MKRILWLITILWCSQGFGAIVFVNSQHGSGFLNSPGAINCTALNVTAGNALVVFVFDGYAAGDPNYALTDTAGNSFTRQAVYQNTSFNENTEIYTVFSTTGNASDVITATTSVGTGVVGIIAEQFSGAGSFDVTANATAVNATTLTSSSFTPTNSGDVALMGAMAKLTTNWTAGGSYTIDTNASISDATNNIWAVVEYFVGTGTGSQTASITITSTTQTISGGVGTAKPGGATLPGNTIFPKTTVLPKTAVF